MTRNEDPDRIIGQVPYAPGVYQTGEGEVRVDEQGYVRKVLTAKAVSKTVAIHATLTAPREVLAAEAGKLTEVLARAGYLARVWHGNEVVLTQGGISIGPPIPANIHPMAAPESEEPSEA